MTASPPDDRDIAELRAFLADRDVACPGCGYNLRGLTGRTCPECSRVLDVTEVRERGDRSLVLVRMPWVAAAVAAAWVSLAVSSTVWLGVSPVRDNEAMFVFLPLVIATPLCVPLIVLCLMRFPRTGAHVIAFPACLMAISLAVVALLIWA